MAYEEGHHEGGRKLRLIKSPLVGEKSDPQRQQADVESLDFRDVTNYECPEFQRASILLEPPYYQY